MKNAVETKTARTRNKEIGHGHKDRKKWESCDSSLKYLPCTSPMNCPPKVPMEKSPSNSSSIFDKTTLAYFERDKENLTKCHIRLKLNNSIKLNPIYYLKKDKKRVEMCDSEIMHSLLETPSDERRGANASAELENIIKNVPKTMFGSEKEEKYFRVFSTFRVSEKIAEGNKMDRRQNSELTNFLELFRKKDLIPPLNLAILNESNKKNEYILRNFKPDYAASFGIIECLKNKGPLKIIDLSENDFREPMCSEILTQIVRKMPEQLFLSGNRVGQPSLEILKKVILSRPCYLKELHLENIQLSDGSCSALLQALEKNCTVRILNLSKNLLTDRCSSSMSSLLKNNDTIEELYLHWNTFKGDGCAVIAQGILENVFLKVLDFSWNALGNSTPENIEKICQTISNPKKKLVHMDFSFNKFTKEETELFGKSLALNHTLFGFHFDGHQASVNEKGQMVLLEESQTMTDVDYMNAFNYDRIRGIEPNVKRASKSKSSHRSSCWICDGWQEITFVLEKDDCKYTQNIAAEAKVWIHLNFDEYAGHEMEVDAEKNYSLKKLCPPERIKFFFTVEDNHFSVMRYPSTASASPFENIQIGERKLPEFTVSKLNFVDVTYSNPLLDTDYYPNVESIPRYEREDSEESDESEEKVEKVFNVQSTVFRSYKCNEESLIKRSFEFDWQNIMKNFTSLTEEDEKIIKGPFFSCYPLLFSVFKFLSSLTPVGSVFVITQSHFYQFLDLCELNDSKYITPTDLELKYSKTKRRGSISGEELGRVERITSRTELPGIPTATSQTFRPSGNKSVAAAVTQRQPRKSVFLKEEAEKKQFNPTINLNPSQGLTRTQFMEVILRIARDYVLRTDFHSNALGQNISYLIERKIEPQFSEILLLKNWKEKNIYNPECDRLLTKYRFLLQKIFDIYANSLLRDVRYETNKRMWLDEFKAIFNDAELIDNTNFTEKDVYLCFNLSASINVDEINSDRHLQLSFLEFLEAFSRIAEKLALPPLEENPHEWSFARRVNLPLCIKIESLIALIVQRVFDFRLRELYGVPSKSIFAQEIYPYFVPQHKRSQSESIPGHGSTVNSGAHFKKRDSGVNQYSGRGALLKEKLMKTTGIAIQLSKTAQLLY